MASGAGPANSEPRSDALDMASLAQDDFPHASDARGADKDEADTCRICRGEGTDEEPLFYPCKCSGSIKYVHQECLMEWLSHTQKKHCELCKTSFRFTKLYHPGMPNRIPTTVFVRRAALHVLQIFVTWCRGVLVAAVWLLLLPWCMRVVWRSLFWVGDGAWSQDIFVHNTETTEVPRLTPLEMEDRSAVKTAEGNHTTHGLTLSKLLMAIAYTPRNSSDEYGVLLWVPKILSSIPNPFAQIAQIAQLSHYSPPTNNTLSNSTADALGIRSPSLLSDVPFLNWFQSQTANRFIVDVIEGQIITLFVVVAFILIFLIREWVVQQQPVINMVALGDPADPAEHAPLPRVANEEDAGEQVVPVEEVEADDTESENQDVPEHDVGIGDEQVVLEPTIRRVRRSSSLRQQHEEMLRSLDAANFSDELRETLQSGSREDIVNMLSAPEFAESSDMQERVQMAMQASAANDEMNSQHVEHLSPNYDNNGNLYFEHAEEDTEGTSTSRQPALDHAPQLQNTLDEIDAETTTVLQRPNMPARERSFIANEIRRNLDEGNIWSFQDVPPGSDTATRRSESVPDSWEEDGEDHQPEQEAPSDQAPDSEHSSESWQQIPDVIVEDDSNQVLEGVASQDKGKAKVVDQQTAVSPPSDTTSPLEDDLSGQNNVDQINPVDIETQPAHEDHGSDTLDEPVIPELALPHTEEDDAAVVPVVPIEPAQVPQNPLNIILDWMFGDVAPAAPATEEAGNDEHVVRNLADEAPFVLFAGNDPQENNNPPIQDPEVAAAAAQAGIDVNDQEAIEDAEDLEGILELIGMQGPIIGLFQNALFSAVLISATLGCAVWLPYLWGKVVLLFMGSPIALMIKLPLQLIATMTDLMVDVTLFIVAGVAYWSSRLIFSIAKLCSWGTFSQTIERPLRSFSIPAKSLAENAMDRIAKLLVESPLSPRPDNFHFSTSSHAALRSLQNSTSSLLNETSIFATHVFEKASADSPPRLLLKVLGHIPHVLQSALATTLNRCNAVFAWLWTSTSYKITFDFDLGQNTTAAFTEMERWTASDRMIAIFAGYGFFAVAGALYLKRGTPFSTSQQGQKVERIVSDILQQAGGVLKVILIISIEMLAFPLYCGLLLDLAMLPLFKNATLLTRWQLARESPWTSGFVHWFIGTCYMFHFALFVSMCRKIMRKGVLYFIRDPDDPTFHPVRDVLERSVTTQLRKIAFSALVYGALVIVCLGGVVWSLSRVTSEVLPIHWTTEAPSLEFPLDLLFYNFLTPVIIKFYKPSESLHTIYKWWFKKCAGFLRLSNFLFGDKVKEQEGSDGRYVRAPASDQARIPKGQPVFVEVDQDNVRKDGKTEGGVHNSDLVTMVYIPSWFRLRIFAFVVTIWIFMGMSGVSVTILPLLFGRYIFSLFLPATVEMNDIHAFSLGIYTLGSLAYSGYHAYAFVSSFNRPVPDLVSTLHTVVATTSRVGLHVLRFSYVWASLIFIIPFLFAVVLELYFLMPLHAYLGPKEPHVVHVIQDWTLGFLYSRLAARVVLANRTSRPARAFAAVVRDGYLRPNAKIATRCFLIPVLAIFAVAIAVPGSLALVTSKTLYWGASEATKSMVWRFSFPAVGLSLLIMWGSKEIISLLIRWRLVVRDEVYLIGERLHNFGEKRAPSPVDTQLSAQDSAIPVLADAAA